MDIFYVDVKHFYTGHWVEFLWASKIKSKKYKELLFLKKRKCSLTWCNKNMIDFALAKTITRAVPWFNLINIHAHTHTHTLAVCCRSQCQGDVKAMRKVSWVIAYDIVKFTQMTPRSLSLFYTYATNKNVNVTQSWYDFDFNFQDNPK